jgi:hypothetical protein
MPSIARPLINLVLPLLAAIAVYLFGTSRAWAEPAHGSGAQLGSACSTQITT